MLKLPLFLLGFFFFREMKPKSISEDEEDEKWALAQPLELGAIEAAAMASLGFFLSLRRVKAGGDLLLLLLLLGFFCLAKERERERERD
jgi:hypothetical protein